MWTVSLRRCEQRSSHPDRASTKTKEAIPAMSCLTSHRSMGEVLLIGTWPTHESRVRRAYPSMDDNSHKLPPWNSPASYRQLHRKLSSPQRFCPALITLGREGFCEFCDFLCLVNLLSFPGLMNILQFRRNSYIAQTHSHSG